MRTFMSGKKSVPFFHQDMKGHAYAYSKDHHSVERQPRRR